MIAALTVAEVAWAATYLAVAEAQPWIWLLPVAAGAATARALARPPAAAPSRLIPEPALDAPLRPAGRSVLLSSFLSLRRCRRP